MKISCVILTYNEAGRIGTALTHALKWAGEVVVVDKSSTDQTREIASEMGARVAVIPFSRQGHESIEEILSHTTHDWTWGFTPGEVPTKALIDAGKALISDDLDCIAIPLKYYSFGVHNTSSPWSISSQARLIHRKRVQFTGQAHNPVLAAADRTAFIPYSEDCYALHQTHSGAGEFMRAHADYAPNEAANGDPQEAVQRAMQMVSAFNPAFKEHSELLPQELGWKIYWLSVALHAWERDHPHTKQQYAKRAEKALTKWK